LHNAENKIKPLIFIPSPRDIAEFSESVSRLSNYDRYWVKYTPEVDAYAKARKFFLENNYSHFVILPDDLVVTPKQIDSLIQDINEKDYEVISGITNVDIRQVNYGKYCVSRQLPRIEVLTEQSYDWFTEYERQSYLNFHKMPILRVKHIGFPLTFIRRDIVKKLQFKALAKYNCCLDVQFSYDCHSLGIPIFIDIRIVGKHLKRRDGVYDNFGLGTKNPITRFEPATN
jgi:hypothetical protein